MVTLRIVRSMPDYDQDRIVRQQEAEERRAWRKIETASRHLAARVTEYPYAWESGDGAGGGVIETVIQALVDAGFSDPLPFTVPTKVCSLARRDGWRCHYCEAPLGWGHENVQQPQVEHVVPRSQGGSNRMANLVLACASCNQAKHARTPSQWLGRQCCDAHVGV